ncbi:MAG: UrcA family protein [Pseudomonadota bacterium]
MRNLFARRVCQCAALILASSGAAMTAGADELSRRSPLVVSPDSAVVSYADLDISRPEGARELYARLKTAAHSVCDHRYSRNIKLRMWHRGCYSDALDGAKEQLSSREIWALHDPSRSMDHATVRLASASEVTITALQ